MEQAYHYLFIALFIVLGCCILACLIRAIKGPKLTDRVVAGNMIGTVVMMIITMLSGYLKEGYLIDVCTVYAMISFVGVVVLTKVYTRAHEENLEAGVEAPAQVKAEAGVETLAQVKVSVKTEENLETDVKSGTHQAVQDEVQWETKMTGEDK